MDIINAMQRLYNLLDDLHAKQVLKEELEAKIESLTKEIKKLETDLIPVTMDEFGLESFKDNHGRTVALRNRVFGSLNKEAKEAALSWLEDNGFAGGVKTELTVGFSKGALAEARNLSAALAAQGYAAAVERSIHHATLNKVVEEIMGEGQELPPALFNVYTERKVTVK